MLKLSLGIYLTKLSKGRYKELYPNIFGNNHRIYFPVSDDGIAYDITTKLNVTKAIEDLGYKVQDYIGGYATDGKQKFKIGKLLSKNPNNESLLESFKLDPMRANNNSLNIVISRHPYDIGGMSTNRNWDSCMRLSENWNSDEEGCNAHFVKSDILSGTIIAYLTRKDDMNINDPMSRVLIKPLFSRKGDVLMNVSKRVYGLKNESFRKSVINIVDKVFNAGAKENIYYRDTHLHYHDEGDVQSVDTRTEETKKKHKEMQIRIANLQKKSVFDKFLDFYSNCSYFNNNIIDVLDYSSILAMNNTSNQLNITTAKEGGNYFADWICEKFKPSDYELYKLISTYSGHMGYDFLSSILSKIKDDEFFIKTSDYMPRLIKKDGYYGYIPDKILARVISVCENYDGYSMPCDRYFSYIFSNTKERVKEYEEFIVNLHDNNSQLATRLAYYYMCYDVDRTGRHDGDNLYNEINRIYRRF